MLLDPQETLSLNKLIVRQIGCNNRSRLAKLNGNKLILCSSINRGDSIKYDWIDTIAINQHNNHSNNHNNNNVVNGNVINHVNSKPKFHFVNFVEKQMTTMTLTQADYSLIRMEPMIVKQHDNHHHHHHHHRPFGLIFYATRIIPKTIKSSLKRLVAKFNQQQQQQQSSTTSNNNGSNLESPPDNGSHRAANNGSIFKSTGIHIIIILIKTE
ncbi:hypothetical protein DERF_009319, partial [Dermatophagoides farinae]